VIATFRQPFDMAVKTNAVAALREAASTANPSKNEIWLANAASNKVCNWTATSFACGASSAVSGRKTFSPRSSAPE
jgi:hypothetical protein